MGCLNISSAEAWDILKGEKNSHLIDVRTKEEWSFVGYPDLSSIDKSVIRITLLEYPDMNLNSKFISELDSIDINKNDKLFFICRSGGRSAIAAEQALELGFSSCYNVIDGFEGKINPATKHRGEVEGWIFNQLPWEQS